MPKVRNRSDAPKPQTGPADSQHLIAPLPDMRSRTHELFHHLPSDIRRRQPVNETMQSWLIDLNRTSDVDDLDPDQLQRARRVLDLRERLGVDDFDVQAAQRAVVEAFLSARRRHFGPTQSSSFDTAERWSREGRDVFIVVKYMDEAPHIEATLDSILAQQRLALGRVVVVAVDNNSTDGTRQIVDRVALRNSTPIEIVSISQETAGAGNAARLGVDRCLATIHQMCMLDGDWTRLQRAFIAVSDGDTVYHPLALAETLALLEDRPRVDAAMPFLTYKFAASLRLFPDYHQPVPADLLLEARRQGVDPLTIDLDLSGMHALDQLPRHRRVRDGGVMRMATVGGATFDVPLKAIDGWGNPFGVLRDTAGNHAIVLADRTIVLERAPVSGDEAALIFIENGRVRPHEKWRWHAVVGHDLFLRWAFDGLGIPEEMIFPDTSDALKTVRAWAFAIGGQHQLRRPGLRIATGSDYQSGRILQAAGCVVLLGPASAPAETEIDRLTKMVRNLRLGQAVFYGNNRGSAFERATGLYVHMTRIQGALETEVCGYSDAMFERRIFPERILFPLRWIFQNAFRFALHPEPGTKTILSNFLNTVYGSEASDVASRWFSPANLATIASAAPDDQLDIAEGLAERLIGDTYHQIMHFYVACLRHYFHAHRVDERDFESLLDGLTVSRNALLESVPDIDPAEVWSGTEFEIDLERGQVVSVESDMSTQPDPKHCG